VRLGRLSLALAAVLVAALLICAAAWGDREKVKIVPADQALAKNALVRLADLGSPTGWSGGPTKPMPPTSFRCGSYVAKQSDLVLTGNAAVRWMHNGLEIDGESQVLRTEEMVARDWERTVTHAGVTECLRQKFASGLPKGQRLVSFGAIAFPKVAKLTAAYRGLVDVGTGKSAVRVLVVLRAGARHERRSETRPDHGRARAARRGLIGLPQFHFRRKVVTDT
jgi:hypothetical protein